MNLKSILKNLPIGFQEEADAMSEEQLREVIVESSNNIRVSSQEMQDNEGFKQAKEAYKLAAEPFKDAIKAQRCKIEYALHCLDSKGKI